MRTGCLCECENQWLGGRGICNECPPRYMQDNCDRCAPGYRVYPDCDADCQIADNCSGHAWAVRHVSGVCVCDCRGGWEGDDCGTCPKQFTGTNCNECTFGYAQNGTQCDKCTNAQHCNGHACAAPECVTGRTQGRGGCLCNCTGGWEGVDCGSCPEQLGGENCTRCGDGWVPDPAPPDCRLCDTELDCSGHADGVLSDGWACRCQCRQGWEGANCSVCGPRFGGANCSSCADGLDGWPDCRTVTASLTVPCDPGAAAGAAGSGSGGAAGSCT
eukprot:gene5599-8529_t